ncbi:MAG: hypothetical protein LUE64_03770 [Candidatus Gastranaerophilales bacterium]|nr:hypothetical protein [Candidatus Gastranaerophilales bacterium]
MDGIYDYNCKIQRAFTGGKTDNTMQDNEDKTQFLTRRCSEILAGRAEKEVPENGNFTKILVTFDVPETQNQASMVVECDALNPKDSRRVSVCARRKGSDRLTSIYMFKGTKKEVLDYLNNKENYPNFVNAVKDVSLSTDEYFS